MPSDAEATAAHAGLRHVTDASPGIRRRRAGKGFSYRDDAGRSNPTPFFDGLVFHRIIPGFMIQGGCPLGLGFGGPGYTFDVEISPDKDFTKPYMLAMANAGKRMGKGTNGSQFFITVGNTAWLQGKHTIFGEVADGPSREVVDKIAAVPTGANDKPLEDVVIESVVVHD